MATDHIWATMNTNGTTNIHMFVDKYKRLSLFFGYSNDADNTKLKEKDNLFFQGKNNGVFFIINDKTNKNVHNFIETHKSDYVKIETVAEENIDIYKSTSLNENIAQVKVIEVPKPKQTLSPTPPPSSNQNQYEEKTIRKGV
jgi:phosphotransferase system IIB component